MYVSQLQQWVGGVEVDQNMGMYVSQHQQWVGGVEVDQNMIMYYSQHQQWVGGVEVDQNMGRYYFTCMFHNSSNRSGVIWVGTAIHVCMTITTPAMGRG